MYVTNLKWRKLARTVRFVCAKQVGLLDSFKIFAMKFDSFVDKSLY